MKKKGSVLDQKELGETSVGRNQKLRLTKGTKKKKKGEDRELKRRRDL